MITSAILCILVMGEGEFLRPVEPPPSPPLFPYFQFQDGTPWHQRVAELEFSVIEDAVDPPSMLWPPVDEDVNEFRFFESVIRVDGWRKVRGVRLAAATRDLHARTTASIEYDRWILHPFLPKLEVPAPEVEPRVVGGWIMKDTGPERDEYLSREAMTFRAFKQRLWDQEGPFRPRIVNQ